MDDDDYGPRLRRAREAKNMTQAYLARAAGIHQVHVSRYESGTRHPTLRLAQRIALALGRPDIALDAPPPESAP